MKYKEISISSKHLILAFSLHFTTNKDSILEPFPLYPGHPVFYIIIIIIIIIM